MFAHGLFSYYNQSMLFISTALKEKPLALFDFSGSSPYQDYSGYGRSAVATGTPPLGMSFVSGLENSRVVSNTNYITFDTPVFVRGMELEAFSLEAWFRVFSETRSVQKVLSHTDVYDGITVYGNRITFSIPFDSGDSVSVFYDAQVGQRIHAVGTYTNKIISLYINGELVSQESIDSDGDYSLFDSTSTQLVAGTTTGSQRIAMGSAGIYYNALSAAQIRAHYNAGISAPDSFEVPANFNGDKIPVAISNNNLFVNYTWDTSEKWGYPRRRNLNVINDILEPQYIDGIPSGGAWIGVVPLDALDYTSIYGMQLNWSGFPGLVETSVDGTTWYVAGRGRNIASVPQGFNPTDKELLVKVSFYPGWRVTPDSAYYSTEYNSIPGPGVLADRWTSRGTYSVQSGTDIDSPNFFRFSASASQTQSTYGFHLSGNPDVTSPTASSMNVEEGDEIFISSIWRDNIGGVAPVNIAYRFYDVSDAPITFGNLFGLAPSVLNQWTNVTGSITAPSGAKKVSLMITRDVALSNGSNIDIANTEIRVATNTDNQFNEDPYIDNLNVVGFISAATPKFIGRVLTMDKSFPERDIVPLDVNDMSGIEIATGGSLVISADTSDQALPARTIEVLVKKPVDSSSTISSMTGTDYKNGVAGSHTLEDGEWALLHTVASADVTGSITINGPAQISHIAIYPTALTATDIQDIMQIFLNTDFQRVDDSNSIIVTAGTDLVRITDADGQILLSG